MQEPCRTSAETMILPACLTCLFHSASPVVIASGKRIVTRLTSPEQLELLGLNGGRLDQIALDNFGQGGQPVASGSRLAARSSARATSASSGGFMPSRRHAAAFSAASSGADPPRGGGPDPTQCPVCP